MAAKRLARTSGLDYAILSGGDVAPLAGGAVTQVGGGVGGRGGLGLGLGSRVQAGHTRVTRVRAKQQRWGAGRRCRAGGMPPVLRLLYRPLRSYATEAGGVYCPLVWENCEHRLFALSSLHVHTFRHSNPRTFPTCSCTTRSTGRSARARGCCCSSTRRTPSWVSAHLQVCLPWVQHAQWCDACLRGSRLHSGVMPAWEGIDCE